MGRFRFGPLGRMMLVDYPRRGFDHEPVELGNVHESLNGTKTKDVTGTKGEWKIAFEGLDARALSWFAMAHRGALGPRLLFLDEEYINRISASGSSGRSVYSRVSPYAATSGTQTIVASTVLLLPGVLDGTAVSTPGPISALTWTTTGAGTLTVDGIVPVAPGEHLVFSLYALTGTPTLELTPVDANGVPGTPITGTVVVAGTPPRRYVLYTVPSTGVAGVIPVIRHAGVATTTFTAIQLEEGDLPSPWVLGEGVAMVLVTQFPRHRRELGNYVNASITLVEM